jgi:hypothetical protein
MGTDTTGSTVQGLKDGMGAGLCGSGMNNVPNMMVVLGNPSGIVAVQGTVGSDICYDPSTGSVFRGGAVNTQEWVALGSTTF